MAGVTTQPPESTGSPPPAPSAPPPMGSTQPPPEPQRPPTLEERFERFGRGAEDAGKRLGRDAEDAAHRLAANPSVVQAGDTAARLWGLLLIGVGLWFFVEVTLRYDLPAIPWGDVWPLGLIVVGLFVIGRGLTRRRF